MPISHQDHPLSDPVALAEQIGVLRDLRKRQTELKQQARDQVADTGQRIRMVRARYGISLSELSAATGINRGTLSSIEKGSRTLSPGYIISIGRVLVEMIWGESTPRGGAF